jgi:hypothetical protein
MNKIFWICFQCFKAKEEPPEEIKAKPEVKEEESTSVKIPETGSMPKTTADALLMPERKEYIRLKYIRVRSKTSNCGGLNASLSDMDASLNNSIILENSQK